MFEPVIPVVFVVGLLVIVLAVHEAGHYVVAGLAGVPASDRRIVWLALPPHLALPHDGDWVGPRTPRRFATAYGRYDPDVTYGVLYNAAGFFAQAFVLVPVGVAVATVWPDVGLSERSLGVALITTSLWFTVFYLGYDLVEAVRRRGAFGDTTHLWRQSPWYAIGTHGLLFGTHGVALFVLG